MGKKEESKLSLFLSLGSSGQPPTDSCYRFCQMVFLFHLFKVHFFKRRNTKIYPERNTFSHGKEHSVEFED